MIEEIKQIIPDVDETTVRKLAAVGLIDTRVVGELRIVQQYQKSRNVSATAMSNHCSPSKVYQALRRWRVKG